MIRPRTKLEKLLYLTVFIALAIVLNLIEPPVFSFIPGAKLGLANLPTVLVLYIFGPYDSIIVAFFRILLGALVKGTFHPIPFFTSLFGGLGAAVAMAAFYVPFKKHFSVEGISIIGGIINNLLQFFVVLYITKNSAFWYYLPILLLLGAVSGWIIGVIAKLLYNRLTR
ncbi:MAG: Gx transporter family protein [Caldisericaceae bacterium]|nr:Gx transporter family protein [Caldisericaceae bacterium]